MVMTMQTAIITTTIICKGTLTPISPPAWLEIWERWPSIVRSFFAMDGSWLIHGISVLFTHSFPSVPSTQSQSRMVCHTTQQSTCP
jgi:hypothetical protein